MTRPKIGTTAAQIRNAAKASREAMKTMTLIVEARYRRSKDELVVRLNTGATLTVARRAIPGFEGLSAYALRNPVVESPGVAVWFEEPDVGVRLETLVLAALGESLVQGAAAVSLGRRTSARKAASSAANGALGGRPRKASSARR